MKKRVLSSGISLFLVLIVLITASTGIFAVGPGGSTMTRNVTPVCGPPEQIFNIKLTAVKGNDEMAGIINEIKPSGFEFYEEDWGGTFDTIFRSIDGDNLDIAFTESGASGYFEYKLQAGSSSGELSGSVEWAGGGADNLGTIELIICIDNDRDGYNATGGVCCGLVDCDDNNTEINPGAEEICDNIDNDCDGLVDEDLTISCGSGECKGIQTCSAGKWGDCSTKDNNCGTCALCDAIGECNVYDETRDNDCNDNLYCNGEEECSGLFSCSNPQDIICDDLVSCTLDSCNEAEDRCDNIPDDAICDNGLWCDGAETCDAELDCQAGIPVVCSVFDIPGINSCFNSPDDNSLTLDFREEFTSNCNENEDKCTTGNEIITHACSIKNCNAECESNLDCLATECDTLDGCYDNIYKDYTDVSNICLGNCLCTDNQCDNYILEQDNDEDDYSESCGDCNDNDNKMFPGNLEICDGKDNDCDGNTEDGVNEIWYNQSTSCGLGVCAANGNLICENGKQTDTCIPETTNQKPEEAVGSCDGLDNDCDGLVDESKNTYADKDCNTKVCNNELLAYMLEWKEEHRSPNCDQTEGCVSNSKLLSAMNSWKNTHRTCGR